MHHERHQRARHQAMALPTQACSDEAMPRRSGTWSNTSSVTTGTMMAQPKANSPSWQRHQALSGAQG